MSIAFSVICVAACFAFSGWVNDAPLTWNYFVSWVPAFLASVPFGWGAGAIWEWVYSIDMNRRDSVDLTNAQKDLGISMWQSESACFKLKNQGQILEKLQKENRVTPEGMKMLIEWHGKQAEAEREWERDHPRPM